MSVDKFCARTPLDVVRLVRGQPLAWIVSDSGGGGNPIATLLPLLAAPTEGQVTALTGHFARSNPHVPALQRDSRALVLFLGVNGYISPSWMADRTQAPTWNYASARFVVDVEFFEDAARIQAHLRELVGVMEVGRAAAWQIDEMGARYRTLSRRVIGFVAHVREVGAKFKLGQDERDEVFADIVRGLEREHSAELLEWMQAFNPQRPHPVAE